MHICRQYIRVTSKFVKTQYFIVNIHTNTHMIYKSVSMSMALTLIQLYMNCSSIIAYSVF